MTDAERIQHQAEIIAVWSPLIDRLEEQVTLLRAAIEGVLPILDGSEPTPSDIGDWARRVVDAEVALIRTRPMNHVEGAAELADIIVGGRQ